MWRPASAFAACKRPAFAYKRCGLPRGLATKGREVWRLRAGPIEPEEAVSAIRSGDTVVGRFGLVGAPLTLIDALVESSDTDELTIISNYSGERIAAHRARSDRGAIRSR